MNQLVYRFYILALFFSVFHQTVFCQIQVDSLNELNFPLVECSGLININGHFIGHNDSGDDPILYEINTLTGSIIRQVNVNNATHIDWEDICHDGEYIYISDSGNNAGVRTDLKIHKVLIDDFFNTSNENIEAETIYFAYADQIDFSGDESNHNFDCEAIISIGDSLYLFSKNRGDFRSNIYPISKMPGNYLLEKTGSIESQGLITGATYVADSAKVVLTGYTFTEAFLIELSGLEGANFPASILHRHTIPLEGSYQIESITWKEGLDYLIASEGNAFGSPAIYCVRFDIHSSLQQEVSKPENIHFFPNPCQNNLYINTSLNKEVSTQIFDSTGKLVLSSLEKNIDVSDLNNGIYWLIFNKSQELDKQSAPLIIAQ